MSAPRLEQLIDKFRSRLESTNWFLATALVIAVAASLPLLSQAGFLNTRGGGDSPFLLPRVQQLVTALSDGHFPVRWMPDASYGYGYPFFNYYAPLSIYLASGFRFVGFGIILAIQLTQLLGFLVAAWAMFHLGRRWLGSNWSGLLASAAYTLAPFHMVNVYVRGDSLAEFWAMAILPVVLLLADRLVRSISTADNRTIAKASLLFGLSYAALILSHNITALIFTPFILLYLLLRFWPQKKSNESDAQNPGTLFSHVTWPSLALFLGLALSAWFWLPALGEQELAQLDSVTSGYFHFENHFRDADLIQPSIIFDYDVKGGTAFRMGSVQAFLALSGLVVIMVSAWRDPSYEDEQSGASQGKSRRTVLFIVLTLVIATLMITALSRPLWENLPFLPYVQFPWRFLSVQALATSLAIAGIALLPGRQFVVPALVLVALVTSLPGLNLDFLELNDDDVTAQKVAEYEWFTGNIGSTVSAEYLPSTVNPRPFTSNWLNTGARDDVQQLEGRLSSIEIVERGTSQQKWEMESLTPWTVVAFPTHSWPGWIVEIDGVEAESWPAPGSGMITVQIPSGHHVVDLRLTRTPIRWAGELVSLASLIVAIWFLFRSRWRKPSLRTVILSLVILFLLVGILAIWPYRELNNDDLSWDFPQLAYLHHDTEGIVFDNGATLDSYEYDRDQVSAGDELKISLSWTVPPNADVSVALSSPAINRYPNAPLITTATRFIDDQESKIPIIIPDNAPAGLVIPRLLIDGTQAVLSSGQARGDLYLQPIRLRDRPEFESTDGPDLDARLVKVEQRLPELIDLQLQWLTRQSLTRNYNFSLRLTDRNGVDISHFDGQPGYGFQPSSGWQADQWIDDWLTLPIPPGLEAANPNSPYILTVRLYDVETGHIALLRRLGELDWEYGSLKFAETRPSFSLPGPTDYTDAVFGDTISLRGYDLIQTAEVIKLDLFWKAIEKSSADYYHFVHLIEPGSNAIVAQHDSMPVHNTYPTSQWSLGEVIRDPAELDLSDVPPGRYLIVVGLYQDLGGVDEASRYPRLIAADNQGIRLDYDRLILPIEIIIDS